MGTCVAPSLANFFMSVFEEEHILPNTDKIVFYHRFLDDIIAIWSSTYEELDALMTSNSHVSILIKGKHFWTLLFI